MEHAGFHALFDEPRLTLGLLFPIEAYSGDMPTMAGQERLARRAEQLGFSALWFRDVPLRDPGFGDVGQIYDPWVYLGHVAALTSRIALVTGAIVLPLRHPLHVAKAAASVDRLSGGRFVLGVATGDRPREALAFGVPAETRAEKFREHVGVLRRSWRQTAELDVIPKPACGDLPLLVVGRSGQSLEWIAQNADGFVTYPRPPLEQRRIADEYRAVCAAPHLAQSLYIDLVEDKRASPRPIHLGWSLGREPLTHLLERYRSIGVAHVVFNLKYGRRPAAEVVEELGAEVLPHFAAQNGLAVPATSGRGAA